MPLNRPPFFQPLRFVTPAPSSSSDAVRERSREERVAELAYYRAQSRGFQAGHEVEDWLAAEADLEQIDAGTAPKEALP